MTDKRWACALAGAAVALSACASPAQPAPPSPAPSAPVPSASSPATATPSPSPLPGAAVAQVATRDDVITDLAAPWDLAWVDEDTFVLSTRDSAVLYLVTGASAVSLEGPGATTVREMVDATGEGGLLGVAIPPDDPHLVYVYLSRPDDNAVLRLERHETMLDEPVEVVTGIPHARIHNGGRMAFGPDGHLYVATGDAGRPELAQDLDSLGGKILRVVADGSSADGSPAAGNPFDTEIWSWGHRNVQGLGWAADGRMFASELGASDHDELNLIEPGANYGWPQTEGMLGAPDSAAPGATVDAITYPLATWPTSTASPSGIAVTAEGIYVAALRGQALWRVPLLIEGVGEPHVIVDDVGRVRHVELGPDGALYVVTNNTDGRGNPRADDDKVIRVTVEPAF